MKRQRSLLLIYATILGAGVLGGYFQLQSINQPIVAEGRVDLSEIAETASVSATTDIDVALSDLSSANVALTPERPVAAAEVLVNTPDVLVEAPDVAEAVEGSCDILLETSERPDAMIAVLLTAPCHAGQSFVMYQDMLLFKGQTDDQGIWSATVPAFHEQTNLIAAFEDGNNALSQIAVSGLDRIYRVALQTGGTSGLELHVREFDAAYGANGHLHAPSEVGSALGTFDEYGLQSTPDDRWIEVYSVSRDAMRAKDLSLSVELEITEMNCGQDISAKLLHSAQTVAPEIREISFSVPGCAAAGEFLVLKTGFDNVTLALGQ